MSEAQKFDIADMLLADGRITPEERAMCSEFFDSAYPVTICPNGDVVIHRNEPLVLKAYAQPLEAPPPPAIVSSLHFHYDKLTDEERDAVDYAYSELDLILRNRGAGIRGDDTAERVVDAIAAGVLNSRGLIRNLYDGKTDAELAS